MGNLGTVYYSLGNYPKAIDYHQQSLAIQRKLKNRRGEALCLNNLVTAYRYMGEYAKATEYEQQSLAINQEEAAAPTRLWQLFKIVERYGDV